MGQNFEGALMMEIAELEAELSQDSRFIRLKALRDVLSLYQDPRLEKNAKASETSVSAAARTPSRGGNRRSPERVRIVEAARLHILNRMGPVPTREILSHLNDIGIVVTGNPPLNNLSAMLSNSEEFMSHGRSGWTLITDKVRDMSDLMEDEAAQAADRNLESDPSHPKLD